MTKANSTSYPKEKIKILLLENISDSAVKFFIQNGYTQVQKFSKSVPEDQLIQEIKDVHILGIRSKTRITKKVLDAAKKLQAIGCFCIGVTQVDLKEATKKGVVVFNAPYSSTRSVAEMVIGSAIMLLRRIPDMNKAAHEGVWLKESKGSYEFRGKTMGIVGYGNIGVQVGLMAEALGMQVIFYDQESKMPLGNAENVKTLKELFGKSDIVSLHVPEIAATKNMINQNSLRLFKKGAILINYARGGVMDFEALRNTILEGHIGGAAVDVFPGEPEKKGDPFKSPLQGCPNVLLTPHIGGSTEEAQENIGEDVSLKLFNYLEKGITFGSHTVPGLTMPSQEEGHRILHIHNNIPGVLSEINTQLSNNNINILAQYLKTNPEIGYVVFDINKQLSSQAMQLLKGTKGTIKVRMLY